MTQNHRDIGASTATIIAPSHRAFSSRTALAVLVSCCVGMAASCSDGSPQRKTDADGGYPSPPATVGTTDQPESGLIAVSEADVTGALDGSQLKLEIPVRNVGSGAASGTLVATILDVEGKKTLANVTLPYDIPASSTVAVTGAVDASFLSAGSTPDQATLVGYNLRLTSGDLRITRSLMYVIPPYDVRVEGPATVSQGKKVSYRVVARNTRTQAPLGGIPVSLAIANASDGAVVTTYEGTTSPEGEAILPVHIDTSGSFRVDAAATAYGVKPLVQDNLKVQTPGAKVLLTTDKPVYQPGQVIHVRTLALGDANKPMAQSAATLEIEDGKGNKILKKSLTTDGYGIASTDFTLGRVVNTGTFTIRALLGDIKSEKTVSVSQYALPKFELAVKTDKTWYLPGDVVTGTVDAKYFFGKLVSGGSVTIEASTLDVGQTSFQKVLGTLDANGHYQFSVQLPKTLAGIPLEQGNAAVSLHLTVVDTAGQTVEKEAAITVSPNGLNVALIPDATSFVPGMANDLLLFVTDPLGNPVPSASAELSSSDSALLPSPIAATTDAFGQASFSWIPPAGATHASFTVKVTPTGGAAISVPFSFSGQGGQEHLAVRSDKAVYNLGDTATVDIVTGSDTRSVYADWLNDGQAVDMRTLTSQGGHATFTMPIDGSLLGSNRVEAYLVDQQGNIVRAGRTIFARNGSALNVALSTDKTTYLPGEGAKLKFSVTDEKGQPAVAALGVQIVDQAVFALVDARPALLKTFFELEDTYAKPTYEIAPPVVDFGHLLFDTSNDEKTSAANQNLAKASFAALGEGSVTGIARGSWKDAVSKANTQLGPVYTRFTSSLSDLLHKTAKQVMADLSSQGCSATTYNCQGSSYGQVVADRVKKQTQVVDLWGNLCQASAGDGSLNFTTYGPDEVAGTADDQSLLVDLSDLFPSGIRRSIPVAGVANGAAKNDEAVDWAAPSDDPSTGSGGTSGAASDQPRVRRDFPETLYVNPAIITGPDGTASVSLDLADSITEWRVSSLANSLDGRLGGGESGIKVFQDFFVDINFPATLTRGDEVSFPIAVYNYLSNAQTVTLSLKVEDWFTATGATTLTLTLEPGQVLGASFPVRVNKVGLRTLTVNAVGTTKSDAVARAVQVLPDGKAVSQASSGLLAAGTTSQTLDFPALAVDGSGKMFVEVYPAFLAHAVGGMDSILREPYGCFEQTTSTTWPNVLVTAYMTKTHQLTPEIQMKAESLISTGYQRLLTFEHPGGGFSWFGTQDPAPYLSVTAFGVMEFADMAKVATVDEAMLARTVHWLASQQGNDGSWTGDRSEFFSFHTSSLRNTAFVVWALSSAGYTGSEIARGVSFVKQELSGSSDAGPPADAYTLALVANALQLAAPDDPATDQVFAQLEARKKVDGDKISWDSGDTHTCFYESGLGSQVSATALAAHAMLLRGTNTTTVDGAFKFLIGAKDASGNFGPTQSTIWALRALLLAATRGTDAAVGALTVSVDGAASQTVSLTSDQSDVMTTVDLSTLATAGSRQISLAFEGTGKVSYNIVGKYNLPWSSVTDQDKGPLTISVAYDKTALYVNDTVTATATVHNNTTSAENMVLVTLGVPPGFEVSTDDLSPYLANQTLSKYELTGKQLILYVSNIAAAATTTFRYGLRATMPVKASDGGGEAHLYYQPDQRSYTAAQALQVTAAN